MNSHTITIDIYMDRDAVYGFLCRPENVPRWAPVVGSHVPVGPHRWRSELARGTFEISFTPPNPFGVLDYEMTDEASGATQPFAMRVVPRGDGCVLTLTLFRRDGASREQFGSDIEWTTTDLLALKALLEAGGEVA